MHAIVRRSLQATLLMGAGGILFAAQACADTTDGSQSVLGGNQVNAPVTAPVTVTGNAVSVAGSRATVTSTSSSTSAPASASPSSAGSSQTTTGKRSIAGGNQVNAPLTAPVTVTGNAVSVAGSRATVTSSGTGSGSSTGTGGASQVTSGSQSVLGGNQVNAPLTAPVIVSGNAVGAVGSTATVTSTGAGSTSGTPSGSSTGTPSGSSTGTSSGLVAGTGVVAESQSAGQSMADANRLGAAEQAPGFVASLLTGTLALGFVRLAAVAGSVHLVADASSTVSWPMDAEAVAAAEVLGILAHTGAQLGMVLAAALVLLLLGAWLRWGSRAAAAPVA